MARRKQTSIRRKLVAITMLTSLFALLVACAAFVAYETTAFRRSLIAELVSLADVVGQNSTAALSFEDVRAAEENLGALAASPHVEAATLLLRDGRVLAIYHRPGAPSLALDVAADGHVFSGEHLLLSRAVLLEGDVVGRVLIQSDLGALHDRLFRYGWIVLAILTAASLAAFILSSRIQEVISQPIRELVATVRRVSADKDFAARAVKRSDDEIGALVDGFNDMMAEVQERDRALRLAREELEHRVQDRTLELQQEIDARKRVEETIRHLAYYDSLTGLPNRLLFYDRLSQALAHADRSGRPIGVLFLDLDRFKNVNDTLGHAVGDDVLRRVAQRLRECVRAGDTVARLGGDEFPIILEGITGTKDAVLVAQKIAERLKPALEIEGHELHVSASIGICMFPADGRDAETLVKNADAALYRAKDQGRNNYQLYTAGMNARALESLVLENSLRRALERDEFVIHYQPQVEPRTGALLGMEALVRWQHAELGLVPPRRFIPLAEETGLVIQLGEWVLRTACEQNRAWQEAGLPAVRVAINLSARHFAQRDFAGTVRRVLEETRLESRYLELELTENVLMEQAPDSVDALHQLREMGVRVCIDDFGTGYSSLSYLKRLPISALKIDQSFVADIPRDPEDTAIASLIITMAHNLNLQVVAEGVETAAQFAFLAESCDGVQGFLLGRPEPAEQATRLLEEVLRGRNLLPSV
jgi:diguanylate cyclase (GGDEF)-like protein